MMRNYDENEAPFGGYGWYWVAGVWILLGAVKLARWWFTF